MRSEDHQPDGWIDTWSGKRFFPLRPSAQEVDIGDIASSLAHQCRFGGHTREYYSVAQHCVHVAELLLNSGDPDLALWGLLHDAAEAYLLDLPRPIKRAPGMELYRAAEQEVLQVVAERFCLEPHLPQAVREADERLFATEIRDLMNPRMREYTPLVQPLFETTVPWPPAVARVRYLEMFNDLQKRRGIFAEVYPSCSTPASASTL